jgi:hypothetical protein
VRSAVTPAPRPKTRAASRTYVQSNACLKMEHAPMREHPAAVTSCVTTKRAHSHASRKMQPAIPRRGCSAAETSNVSVRVIRYATRVPIARAATTVAAISGRVHPVFARIPKVAFRPREVNASHSAMRMTAC